MNQFHLLLLSLFILYNQQTNAQQTTPWSSSRPDGHAPISVMGDHYHGNGEWMVSYRFMPMWMDGNLKGNKSVNQEKIFENYMAAPERMNMQMHMLGVMYAPSDQVTLMLMGNYLSNEMELQSKHGMNFTTSSDGLGDLQLSALLKLLNKNRQSLHAMVGASIPSGSIDERDNTPMKDDAHLAYPMQLGSGSIDPSIGVTYLGQGDQFSWGVQSSYLMRTGENSDDYQLGNQWTANGWTAVKITEYLSASGRMSFRTSEEITGADEEMMPMMMPLFDTRNSGRDQLDAGIGINTYLPEGSLKDLRVGAELSIPFSQQVEGIQMESTSTLTMGIQYTF